jgi:hypothetical protein
VPEIAEVGVSLELRSSRPYLKKLTPQFPIKIPHKVANSNTECVSSELMWYVSISIFVHTYKYIYIYIYIMH